MHSLICFYFSYHNCSIPSYLEIRLSCISTSVLINMGAASFNRNWKIVALKRRHLYLKKFSLMLLN